LEKLQQRRLILAMFVGAFLTAACTKTTPPPLTISPAHGRNPWTIPHVLRIGMQNQPNSLNPILSSVSTEAAIDHLIFDPLVGVDSDGQTEQPVLALEVPTQTNGGISRDGRTITYHLRHGVRWHDDVPFTSKDVKFSIDAIRDDRNNVPSRTGFTLITSVRTPDDFTVVIHLSQAFAPIVQDLFGESDEPYEILPAHLLTHAGDLNRASFNAHPIGTGPFVFKEWRRGDHIELSANSHYFLGTPKLQRIVVRFVPDENTMLNQLRSHDLDWQFEASPQEYRDLIRFPEIRIAFQHMNQIELIAFNTTHPPLGDVRIRQAISYALDRKRLVDDLTFGTAQSADQDLPPFLWAHAEGLPRYAYSPAKARQYLNASGWIPGSDGIRRKAGQKLTLDLAYTTENATRRRGVILVQAMLREVGIDLHPKPYLGERLFAPLSLGGILQAGKYDLAWFGWISGVDPDNSTLVTCGAIPPRGQNFSRYCRPALDSLELQALGSFNRTKRRASYQRIEEILAQDEPLIPLWWPAQIQAVNPDFTDFAPNPVTETWNAYRWDI
jgi:peptide/nickel transport system substrate-binding protein